jgi:hypothetical protein
MQGRCADGTQGDGAVRGVVIEWYPLTSQLITDKK